MNEIEVVSPELSRKSSFLAKRLASLDAYRGLIMITLAFGGFGLAKTAGNMLEQQPDSTLWALIQNQFTHAQWVGCTYWDLIQPSFMFMVGVSMPYSYSKRREGGSGYFGMLLHAFSRSVILVLLGIFLTSNWSDSTSWSFMNVLSQIGLGYTFVFLLLNRSWVTQSLAVATILVATWFLYESHPGTGIDTDQANSEIGISEEWASVHLEGVKPAWRKNANFGHSLDRWLLNVANPYLPRKTHFEFNSGGYQTFNFFPSIATMLLGLMCGEFLRSGASNRRVLQTLLVAGGLGVLWGYNLDQFGISPMIKRLWSPSWVLFSGGCCSLFVLVFYLLFDVLKLKWLAFPLIIVGMNSIGMYIMGMLLKPWVAKTIKIHAGSSVFEHWGPLWEPAVQSISIGFVFCLICFYLYRKRVFLRI
jgi:heparan-alpha-glucosaminide N-acetyltransferase